MEYTRVRPAMNGVNPVAVRAFACTQRFQRLARARTVTSLLISRPVVKVGSQSVGETTSH